MNRRDVGVIVVAAGRSTRMGESESKVWLDLDGVPVLALSLRTIARFERLAELALVVRDEDRERAAALLARDAAGLASRARVVPGGAERRDSVRCGLAALSSPDVRVVLVHDAARPLASLELFERVAAAVGDAAAVVPALAVADTLRRRGADGRLATVPRDGVHAVQTPQGFSRALLERVIALESNGKEITDEAVLVELAGGSVALVDGEPANLKITRPADVALAIRLLRGATRRPPRIGLGQDLHRLEAGGPLRLGGLDLEAELHAVGHSDGDVLLHALADAILGALALGDLGQHFSDRDAANRGRDSADFLRHALALARERGYATRQVDVVVHLERPRLARHHDRLVGRVAELLGLEPEAVSIKAKTGEGLGPVGEGRAIACDAIVQMAAAD